MRSVVAGVALALLAVGCGDDSGKTTGHQDSGTSTPDGGGNPNIDGGHLIDAGTDGSTTPPQGDAAVDLTNVCPGNDAYEPNNDNTTAKAIALAGDGTASLGAGVKSSDADWFSFVAPKSDPVTVTVDYTVGLADNSQLALEVRDATNSYVDGDDSERSGNSQTLVSTFEATTGGHYFINLNDSADTCTGYALRINALACTDTFEDNDTNTTASQITLDSTLKFAASAKSDGLDDDWYQFTASKNDPVLVSASYSRPAGDTVDLSLEIRDTTNSYIDGDDHSRTGASEAIAVPFAATATGIYRIHVSSDTQGTCADYDLKIDGAYCTDSFEDNDTMATTHPPLTSGAAASVTISQLDDDFYAIPAGATHCSVSYTVDATSAQQLTAEVRTAADDYVMGDTSNRAGTQQTLNVSWASTAKAAVLIVRAGAVDCTQYTVTCS